MGYRRARRWMSVPTSTYRIQLHSGFGFDDAASVVDYLHELGVSHVYCSPYLQAAPGSTHGYDIVDYHRVSADLGGEEALEGFRQKLKDYGMGQILDMVPNHMAIMGSHNLWWWDTLENGPLSRYAPYFDIDWNGPEERLRAKILLPVLGDHYGRVLAAREIRLERRQGSFVCRYYEHEFPVAPESCAGFLGEAARQAGSRELEFLADSLARLPNSRMDGWEGLLERHRNKEVIRELLGRLCAEQGEAAAQIDAEVSRINLDTDALDALLARQHYRLSRWRTAERELIYRRFFDINSLVGIRTEDERVFEDTHRLVLDWLQRGRLDGVRVDHPDGLSDPTEYFRRLRQAAPDAWIVAEKILQPGESLPESWDIAGTTGYEFLNLAGGLFVDPRGEAALNEIYRDFKRETVDFEAVAKEKKGQIVREILGSDINRLTGLFVQICENHRDHRDYTRHEIHEAIREVVAAFPVYRTYVRPAAGAVSEADQEHISQAVRDAKAARRDVDKGLFGFLEDVLFLREQGLLESEFVARFQQVTAAAMAKGIEDTAFYSYLRLTSLNEVGGNPGRFCVSAGEFHKWCSGTQKRRPLTMLTTSTHDTKRSEDVRCRISILSEIPDLWTEAVRRWSSANSRYRVNEMPDRKTEYLLYQTLMGAWPLSKDRLGGYMRKAAREAKEHTSWISPNVAFEEALEKFVEAVLADEQFIADLENFLAPLLGPARETSLSLIALKLTAPGVPDTYQGTEVWDSSLVDPDNRRPVDFELRKRLLCELQKLRPEQVMERAQEGLPKLWLIRQALRVRAAHPESFGAEGSYQPLWPTGPKSAHLIAFQRGENVITAAPRLRMSLDGWGKTFLEIPEGSWRNQLTANVIQGGKVGAQELLSRFPVALLTRET
jgi:(1->4)-alpha-D-glucan 1-alpha-D-glucosylmutase